MTSLDHVTPAPGQIVPMRRARDRQRRVANVLLDILAEAGVDVVFGLPGGGISPLFDAMLEQTSATLFDVRHETSAVYAAAGHALASGSPGVVAVTSGPGATNALTGLASVFAESIPIVVLIGEVPRPLQGRGALQDGSASHLDLITIARRWTKSAIEIRTPAAAPAQLRRALAIATSGKPGPVAVTLPLDVAQRAITVPELTADVRGGFDFPDPSAAHVARRLLKSRRGAIFAGSGVRGRRTPALLRQLAERMAWPVMTSPKAKGVFPETHPLSLGVFGIGGHPSTHRYLASGLETLLVLGSSLGDVTTEGWSDALFPTRTLIQVDIDGSVIGRAYPVDVAVTAPVELFFDRVLRHIPSRAGSTPAFGVERCELPPDAISGKLTGARAVREIQRILSDDTVYVVDSGEHFLFAVHFLEIGRPDAFVAMTGLGAMGSSIPVGIGVQLANPERTVAVIVGDGGYAMIGNDVATAVAKKLPLRVFVFNDGRLSMVEGGHRAVYGRSPPFPVAPIDIVQHARSVGAKAIRVERPNDLLDRAALVLQPTGPVVVDVCLDSTIRLPKRDRIGAMRDDS